MDKRDDHVFLNKWEQEISLDENLHQFAHLNHPVVSIWRWIPSD